MNVNLLLLALSILFISVSCQSLGQALSKDSATISGQFSDLKSAFDAGMAAMPTQIKDAVSSAQIQLQNVFSGTNAKDALANLGTKVGDMSTQVQNAVGNVQSQLQTIATNGTQVAATKDALAAVGAKAGDMSTQVQNAVANAQNQLLTVSGNGTPVAAATKDALTALGTKVGEMSTQVQNAVGNAQTQLQTIVTNGTKVAPVAATTNLGTKIADVKNFAKTFWNNDVSTKLRTSAQKLLDFKGVDSKYSAPKDELAQYMVNTQSTPNITDMINLARKHLTADEAGKFFDQLASIAEQQKW